MRRSAKATFKAAFPSAASEMHKGNDGKRYYLVRKKRTDRMWYASGDTEAQAWADAVKKAGLDKPKWSP